MTHRTLGTVTRSCAQPRWHAGARAPVCRPHVVADCALLLAGFVRLDAHAAKRRAAGLGLGDVTYVRTHASSSKAPPHPARPPPGTRCDHQSVRWSSNIRPHGFHAVPALSTTGLLLHTPPDNRGGSLNMGQGLLHDGGSTHRCSKMDKPTSRGSGVARRTPTLRPSPCRDVDLETSAWTSRDAARLKQ